MARIYLTLLGGFQVRSDAGLLTVSTKKAQALLAYLALPAGQAHPRDKLAALLWGDTAEEQARASLRQALFALRKALPATALLTEAETVALNPAVVAVDVGAFERRVAEGTPEALAEAATLYHGDLLAGLALKEAPFEEWLLGERERLRELALEGLAKLLAQQRAAGATETAVQTALRLLTLDPLQEPVHRTLMRLYAQLGQRGAALRQYQHCVGVLQRELGAEPEGETKQLYQGILRQRPVSRDASETPVTVPAAAPPAETPLIGREAELSRLRRVMDEAWHGRGQVVAIVGETGIGKSRLIEELAADALKGGGVVLLGGCHESEQILPFAAWADAFRQGQVLGDPEVMEGVTPAWRAELARLFPEVATPGLPRSAETGSYLRLFEAMVRCVERRAARQPLLLILEDLHWADELSLRLLSFLGRRVRAWPGLVVGTVREEELADASVLRHVLEELRRADCLVELTLPPLSQPETVALVRALARAGTEPAAAARLGEQVWTVSEGNPFMIVETMRALQEQDLSRAPAVLPLPRRVHSVIAGRLERLSAPSRELAAVAAVVGREFDFALLHHAAGGSEQEIAAGLEELMQRHVLRSIGERFAFKHDRIREVAYAELLRPRRTRVHAAVANALEATYADDLEPHYGALATHYREGESWDKAVEYLTRFGRKAVRLYAHAEAVAAFEEALRHVERLPVEAQDARRLDIVPRLARALTFLGRFDDAVALLLRQEARVEQVQNPRLSAGYYLLLAHTYTFQGDRERVAQTAHRAVEEARRCGDDATMGKALYVLAMEGYWSGQPLQGLEYGRQAVTLLEPTRDRWWLGQAHFSVGTNYFLMGELDRALAAAAEAYAIGEAIGDPRVQTPAAWLTGVAHASCGDSEQAIEACQRALDLSPDPLNTADALGWLGYTYLDKGDAPTAIGLLEQSVRQWRQFRLRPAQGCFLVLLGEAYLLDGQVDRALDLAAQGLQLTSETRYLHGVGWGQRLFGRIERARGRLPEAEAHFHQARETFASIGARFELARTYLDLAELAHARGSAEMAAAHLSGARDLFIAMRIPKYVARSEQAAQRLGVPLQPVGPGSS